MSREHKRMLLAIFLVAATMRAPITATGVLTAQIRDALALTASQGGLVTTVPLLIFFASSPVLPGLSRRYGINRILFLAMVIVFIGQGIRYFSGFGGFLMGTAIMALGISAANVLLPSLLKLEYPTRVGIITSIYVSLMTFSSGISSGLTIPLIAYRGLGWREALMVWSIIALSAVFLWGTLQKRNMIPREILRPSGNPEIPLWRQPLAWQVTAFMGLQSFIFYSLITWLPDILTVKNLSPGDISLLLSLFQFISIPAAFFIPIFAERLHDQRYIGMLTGAFYLVGLLLLWGSTEAWQFFPVIVVLALGGGSTISLAMLFFNQRTRDSVTAGRLSGMAQAFGYLLAALGPVLLGRMYDATQTWSASMFVLIGVGMLLVGFGYLSGRRRFVR